MIRVKFINCLHHIELDKGYGSKFPVCEKELDAVDKFPLLGPGKGFIMHCAESRSGDVVTVQTSLKGICINPFCCKYLKGNSVTYAYLEMAEFSRDAGSRIAEGASGRRNFRRYVRRKTTTEYASIQKRTLKKSDSSMILSRGVI